MPFELKDGQGTLWWNDRKDADNQPDWRGTVKLNGKEWALSAWIKKGQRGEFLSLSIQEPRPKTDGLKTNQQPVRTPAPSAPRPQRTPSPATPPEGDEPPF